MDTRWWSKPVAIRLGVARPDGDTRACTSTRTGRLPSMLAATADPATPVGRSERNISDGLATSASPSDFISKTPISLVDPKRFRSEEHTSELQSRENLVCRLLLEKKKHVSTMR